MNTAALIIDCWENSYITPNIIQHLKLNSDITVVIVASYTQTTPLKYGLVDHTDSTLVEYLHTQTRPVLNIVHYKKLKRAIEKHNITTVSVMGAAWKECLYFRPVGVLALQQLPIRVVIDPHCVQLMNTYTDAPVHVQLSQDPEWTPQGSVFLMK